MISLAKATPCPKQGLLKRRLYQALIQNGDEDKELPRLKLEEQWTSMTGIRKKDSLIPLKTTSSQIATIHSVNER